MSSRFSVSSGSHRSPAALPALISLSLSVSLFLSLSLSLLSLSAPARAVPGDIDGVNGVTLQDASLALRIAGGLTPASPLMVISGDVASNAGTTPDGQISYLDALRIARAVNGLDDLGGGGFHPLPLYTTLNVAGPTVKDFQLPNGFIVRGTVAYTGAVPPANIYFMPSSADYRFGGYGTITEGAYTATLAAGTYTPDISTDMSEQDPTGMFTYDYSVNQAIASSFTVVKDATQNFTRPNLPGAAVVTATVNANFDVTGVDYSVTGTGYNGSSTAVQNDTGQWIAKVPSGQVHADVNGSLTVGARTGTVDITAAGAAFTVGTSPLTETITAPSVVQVTGTITPPPGHPLSSITFTSTATTGTTVYSDYQFGEFSGNPSDNSYMIPVPTGHYRVEIAVDSGITEPAWTYVTEVDVAGASTKNFTLPALPAPLVTVSGKVLGPDGKSISGYVSLTTSGTAINRWIASNGSMSNSLGEYSLTLPAGSYDVSVYHF